jgi:hypothetical protein
VLGWRPSRSGEACPIVPCPSGAGAGPRRESTSGCTARGRAHNGGSACERPVWRKKVRLDRGMGLVASG